VLSEEDAVESGCGVRPVGDSVEVHLVLKGMVDLDAEIAKLDKSTPLATPPSSNLVVSSAASLALFAPFPYWDASTLRAYARGVVQVDRE